MSVIPHTEAPNARRGPSARGDVWGLAPLGEAFVLSPRIWTLALASFVEIDRVGHVRSAFAQVPTAMVETGSVERREAFDHRRGQSQLRPDASC